VPEVAEEVINVKLADILRKDFGIDARAERVKGRRRPDIRCYYKGFIIGIEASYNKNDAEKDAENRIEQGLVDIALALWIKEKFKDMPEEQLYEAIKKSLYSVKVFTLRDISITLLQFLEKSVERKAEPATGWFEDVNLPSIKMIIEHSIGFMIKEEEVQTLMEKAETKFNDFIETLRNLDPKGIIRENLYGILYRLYGLSVAEKRDPEVMFGHAALSILLSTVFYEHIRNAHPELQPVTSYVNLHGPIEGLRKALEDLLKKDYRTAVKLTIEILHILPQQSGHRVGSLINLGVEISSKGGLLRRDFAGKLYHKITGDIALRKGFATFYTEVPAAYLLATLATQTLLGLDKKELLNMKDEAPNMVRRINRVKLCDFACGSGTLLTASYYSFHRIATMLKYYYDLQDLDLEDLGKKLIEEGIYGIDALRYASQITAINLALMGPSISKENVYSIYLGYLPRKNSTWLGSLELLNNGGRVGGILAFIEGGLKGIAEAIDLGGTEEGFSIPDRFHMVIMNPPFTRATGRTKKFKEATAGGEGLFGFIADENIRELILRSYRDLRDTIKDRLMEIAKVTANTLPNIIRHIVRDEPKELRQYLSIGQAGEGLLFLYLAYRYIENGGVIAFVLPRGILAGASWFLARTLLASKFHVKYVVVSSDPESGYNFSESTSLSETLLVAKRIDEHEDVEETVFINLLCKPSTALEAIMLAEEVKKATSQGNHTILEVGKSKALIYKVKRRELLNNIDNWNRFVSIPDVEFLSDMLSFFEDGKLPYMNLKVPLTYLNELIDTLGIDRHQFHDHFTPVRTLTHYSIVYGGEEEVRQRMLVEPNMFADPRTDRARFIFEGYSGKLLLPDRISWSTAHALALFSRRPTLSNIFYAVRLKTRGDLRENSEKALALWLNTTWGLLTILVNREETGGQWSELKMAHWRLLRTLDVTTLGNDMLKKLAEVFDRYSENPLRRIPDQFNPDNPDPVRLGIDRDFIKVLDPTLEDGVVEERLKELYKRVNIALKRWIG
jgi:hypothetical protein